MNKIKNFFKENYKHIIIFGLLLIIVNFHLPFYIMIPGGTIDITDRINIDDKEINGSINLLYAKEVKATIPTYLISLINDKWDNEKISDKKVNTNETVKEIELRDKIMLENSIQNAIFSAYHHADIPLTITSFANYVIGVTENSKCDLKNGDNIIKANNKTINNLEELKQIISDNSVNAKINLLINRKNKEQEISCTIFQEDNEKYLGVMIVTNYNYKEKEDIEIKFNKNEGGSSGGLMLALSIYDMISDGDLVKGRKIAGTGTIDNNGNVGEIAGVKYKIIGAARNNVNIVLVPKENYQEAVLVKEKYNYDLKIVSVKTLNDAIEYLEG